MSMVRNGMVSVEVVAFCHMTCRYFDRFLLQGVDKNWRQACFFYLAPSLICEGYWQVNSRRSIFRIADPTMDRNPRKFNPHKRYCTVLLLYYNSKQNIPYNWPTEQILTRILGKVLNIICVI